MSKEKRILYLRDISNSAYDKIKEWIDDFDFQNEVMHHNHHEGLDYNDYDYLIVNFVGRDSIIMNNDSIEVIQTFFGLGKPVYGISEKGVHSLTRYSTSTNTVGFKLSELIPTEILLDFELYPVQIEEEEDNNNLLLM